MCKELYSTEKFTKAITSTGHYYIGRKETWLALSFSTTRREFTSSKERKCIKMTEINDNRHTRLQKLTRELNDARNEASSKSRG